LKIFSGHEARVYNILINPLLPGIMVSGSDDYTVRVWDITAESQEALQILGESTSSDGHTSNVRGMAFVPEMSWCLLTGSWDSTIRMWDIRSGK
jgi:WD40 repeat protein